MNIITFVTTHNPNNVYMFNFLQINKEIFNNSTRCKDVFKNTTFVNSKRQNQTLKSILVRASFQNSELHKPTISKCGKSRRGCCNNILEQSSLYFYFRSQKMLMYIYFASESVSNRCTHVQASVKYQIIKYFLTES